MGFRLHSHNSFSFYVLDNVSPPDPETVERNILTVPLYHVAGIQAMMAAIYGGRTLVDEHGYFFLAGRTADMIKRGGELISPEEVEAALQSHAKIEEAALIGIPDVEWGELPMAVVVLKKGETATEEEIIEYCRAKLASYKRPRSVVFVDELPRNPMGKVLKRVLREQYGRS